MSILPNPLPEGGGRTTLIYLEFKLPEAIYFRRKFKLPEAIYFRRKFKLPEAIYCLSTILEENHFSVGKIGPIYGFIQNNNNLYENTWENDI
jgi:hypothetical protein